MRYILIFFLCCWGEQGFSQVNCPDLRIDSLIKKSVKHKLKSKKFISKNLNRKEVLKYACNKNSQLQIFPIYWFLCDSNYFKKSKIIDTNFLRTLRFSGVDLSVIEAGKIDNAKKILFGSILFNDCGTPILSFSEAKQFYRPSEYDKILYSAIKKYDIQCAYYVINIPDENMPYFLIDREGDIFVLNYVSTQLKKIDYEIIRLSQYQVIEPTASG